MNRLLDLIAGGAGWRQTDRLLTLTTPLGPDVLLAETATIVEALGPVLDHAGFRIELTVLSADAELPLTALLGQPARLDLQTSASRTLLRPFHGHITRVARLGADGGFARYRLTIEPWLSFLAHTQDSYLFQDKTLVEIVDELLGDWNGKGKLVPAWRWELADPDVYPKRGMTCQYRESDLAFLKRLLAEEGLFCWFEHQTDTGDTLGSHTLVIADHNAAFTDNSQARARFTQSGATLAEDGIDRWHSLRQLDTGTTQASSWDYRSLSTRPQAAPSATANSIARSIVSWDDPGPYAWPTAAHGERMIERRQQAIDARLEQYVGAGTVRTAAPGTNFDLADHPEHDRDLPDRRRFVITAVTHRARNNLATPPEQASAERNAVDLYRNEVRAVRASVPWRPVVADAHGRRIHPRPTVSGPLTAIVVGDGFNAGEPAPTHTDRDLRIHVQFPWQRGSRSASRQLHPSGADNAPAHAGLGVWLRVLRPMAGANWGGHFTPRPGQEVLVAFQNGNIDRPVIIGGLYNGQGQPDAAGNRIGSTTQGATANAPAWFAGETDPAHTHGASLSGIKTQQLSASRDGQGGYNQLVFDDTPGQSRIELSTTEYASRLQLGHLKQQADNARLANRGHGAELATEAAIALRAGNGLLVSADARSGGAGSHLDSREAIAQTEDAQALVLTLADVAHKQKAALKGDETADKLPASVALGHAAKVLAATETRQASVDTTSRDSSSFAATRGGTGTVAAWCEPRLQFSAPAGIAQLTPKNQILTAGGSLIAAAGQDIQLVTQGRQSVAVKDGLALFTVGKATKGAKPNTETGIHLHAASGQVSVQSQSGKTLAAADKTVTVASTTASVIASAKQHLLATAQGAYLRISGGNIELHAPGKVELKASMKNLTGPASVAVVLPSFPVSQMEESVSQTDESFTAVFDIGSLTHNDPSLLRTNFEVWTRGEQPELIARGALDELCRSFVVRTKSAEPVELLAGEGEWMDFIDSLENVRELGELA
ncbi:MAG TPA: type VI secretion system Vgr family protein [Aromatoleum sp.]|uniref:type VI secretion system Vgr family protein n=1 Tax=Aromatoleum sp. TaxID=2307007 RepID=UPI002B46A25F|nr:type VI secretion system Vgr family protein [Aromatoleum sp.]HJV27657.1 type VI secretion system Vgr family protein [Aromatoleum sp.]